MEGSMTAQRSYQSLLGALGSYLDEEPTCRINIVEVPDGFLVRTQRTVYTFEPSVKHFKRDTLLQRVDQFIHTPQPTGVHQRHQGIWARIPNGHEEFMRSLGCELDGSQARNIVVDELEDGLNLTYTEPTAAGEWETRVVFLSVEGIETMLNEAFNRRRRARAAVEEPSSGREV